MFAWRKVYSPGRWLSGLVDPPSVSRKEGQDVKNVMPNLFRHLSGHSSMLSLRLYM
jgi:hypothetical protein